MEKTRLFIIFSIFSTASSIIPASPNQQPAQADQHGFPGMQGYTGPKMDSTLGEIEPAQITNQIREALDTQNLPLLENLVAQEMAMPPQSRNAAIQSLLHAAAEQGNVETVKMLLAKGLNQYLFTPSSFVDQSTPFYHAIIGGNVDTIKVILNATIQLHLLLRNNHHDTYQEWQKKIVNQYNEQHASPLTLAHKIGRPEVITLLKNYGAEIGFDYTPALKQPGLKQTPSLQPLKPQETQASEALIFDLITQGKLEDMLHLVRKGINLNVFHPAYGTPLSYALELKYKGPSPKIKAQCNEIVRFLLDNGAATLVNIPHKNACTPLLSAVMKDDLETARLLLERGAAASVNIGLPKKDAPLFPVEIQEMREFQWLTFLEKADQNILSKNAGMPPAVTPLSYARSRKKEAMIQLLEKYNAQPTTSSSTSSSSSTLAKP